MRDTVLCESVTSRVVLKAVAVFCFCAVAAVAAAVRFNGPLGAADAQVQQQWLPGTIHLSIWGASGFEIANALAVRVTQELCSVQSSEWLFR